MKKLFEQPNMSLNPGIRDRTIMEVLYATAMRIDELLTLEVHDVDLRDGVIFVRKAKGGRQRVVPLGKSAGAYLGEYLDKVRPRLGKKNPKARRLFQHKGEPMTYGNVRQNLYQCARSANLGKPASPHVFRRSCATHMLKAGADIRHIQKILGHARLATTQQYCKVIPIDIKKTTRRPTPMDVKNPAEEYLKHLQARNCSPHTVKNSKSVLKLFAGFLEEEGIVEIDQLTREVLEDYQQELAFTLTATGKPLAVRTQGKRLSVIKGFSRYLKEHDYLIHDPGAIIKLPRQAKQLPRAILDEPEIKKLIAAPDTRTNRGYRNRVIVELLYDTAIRRSEIADVKITDIDLDGGFLLVRGKGNKERVVPVSGRVSGLVRNYILAVRPAFINGDDPAYLILNRWVAGWMQTASGRWSSAAANWRSSTR